MSAMWTLSVAMWRGFVRDKMTVFWIILFPLMFLVLFGGIFTDQGQSKVELMTIGNVAIIDNLPDAARAQFDDAFDVKPAPSREAALDEVRNGDVDAAVEQHGDQIDLHFSQADLVTAATVQGLFGSFVDNANVAATGQPPT